MTLDESSGKLALVVLAPCTAETILHVFVITRTSVKEIRYHKTHAYNLLMFIVNGWLALPNSSMVRSFVSSSYFCNFLRFNGSY